jgi:hypothetical protein
MLFILYLCLVTLIHGFKDGDDVNYCKTYDTDTLFNGILSIYQAADADLSASDLFEEPQLGYLVTIINSTAGNSNGGATNPDGLYQTYLFKSELLPAGACEIPSCTNTSVQECHARCSTKSAANPTGADMSFTMGPNDVIVSLACTPPEVKYFSNDIYISTRELHEQYPFYPGINFGDVGLNNKRINVNNEAPYNQEEGIWNKPYSLFTSADKKHLSIVQKAYEKYFPTSATNIRQIDQTVVNMYKYNEGESVDYKDTKPDLLFAVTRASLPVDEAAFEVWQRVVLPVRYYRAKNMQESEEPYKPTCIPRIPTTIPEAYPFFNEKETLQKSYDTLKESVISNAQQQQKLNYVATLDLKSDVPGFYDDWNSILAMKNNASFIIPTRDALYGMPAWAYTPDTDFSTITITDKTHAVFIGIRHSVTLGASYSQPQLAIQKFPSGKVTHTIAFNDDEVVGSAERYFTGNSDVSKELQSLFYAVDIRPVGQCEKYSSTFISEKLNGIDTYCFEFFPQDSDNKLNLNTHLLFPGERIYALSSTTIGPATETTLMSELLVFSE